MSAWRLDLGFAARALRCEALGSAIIMVTLAALLGTTTAFFSLYFGIRFRPHDIPEPHRVLEIATVEPAVLRELVARSKSFEALGGGGAARVILEGHHPQQVAAAWVSPDWFAALRPPIILGRGLRREDHAPTGPAAVVLGERLWRESFAGAPDVIGQTLSLRRYPPFTIVGVMSDRFAAPDFRTLPVEVWLPERTVPRTPLRVMARLRPGVPQGTAVIEARTLVRAARARHGLGKDQAVMVMDFRQAAGWYQQRAMFAAFVAALFLLLAGTANVGSQLAGRSLRRRRQQVMQLAIGADSQRIIRQIVVEAGLLVAAAAVLGAGFAAAWLKLLKATYASAVVIPGFRQAGLDLPTAAFAGGLVVTVALLISVPAALQVPRRGLHAAMKESGGGHSGARRHRRWREALLVVQVALTSLLFVTAGTWIGEVARRVRDKGFAASGVTFLRLDFRDPEIRLRQAGLRQEVIERLAKHPDVEAAGFAWPPPFANGLDQEPLHDVFVSEPAGGPGRSGPALVRTAGGDLLGALSIPLVRGRTLSAASAREALVDRRFVSTYLADTGVDPLGRTIELSLRAGQPKAPHTVVGVVGDVKHRPDLDQFHPTIYVSDRGEPDLSVMFFARGRLAPAALANELRRVVRAVEPRQPIAATGGQAPLIATYIATPVMQAVVIAVFSLIAVILAALGLNAAAVSVVVARRNEFGVRMALGARPWTIAALVLRQGMKPVLGGLAGGMGFAWLGEKFEVLPDWLLDNRPLEGGGVALIASFIVLVTGLSLLAPAWLASRRSLLSALRYE